MTGFKIGEETRKKEPDLNRKMKRNNKTGHLTRTRKIKTIMTEVMLRKKEQYLF